MSICICLDVHIILKKKAPENFKKKDCGDAEVRGTRGGGPLSLKHPSTHIRQPPGGMSDLDRKPGWGRQCSLKAAGPGRRETSDALSGDSWKKIEFNFKKLRGENLLNYSFN